MIQQGGMDMSMKFCGRFCAALLLTAFCSFGTAQAASSDGYPQEVEEIPETATSEDTSNADEWFFSSSDKDNGKQDYSAGNKGKGEEKPRFEWILTDGSYQYFMDRKGTKWVRVPYSSSEYMIDTWIRLISTKEDSIVDEYDSEGNVIGQKRKYFLEHYYIRPMTQQIQFLSELEVTGRPQNMITEREYSMRNWENLIPESIEDEIYRAVVKRMGGKSRAKGAPMGVFDMLDEYGRIAM